MKAVEQYLSSEYSAEIAVGWMYIMDHLIENKNNSVHLNHILDKSHQVGFNTDDMRAMIEFYH